MTSDRPQETDSTAGVERHALRGVPWTVLGYITSRAVSLLGTLAIARLLVPEDLGVVYTGMIVVSFVNLLTDSGLGLTMVTRERLDDRMAGTILTCMTAGGVILSAAVALGAVATAWIAEPSRLTTIMPALSTVAIFTAVGYFHTSLLHRAMEYSRRFAGQFALSVGYVAVALPLVALGAGVWGLVAGQILAAALSAAVLVAVTPHRVRPRFHRGDALAAYREARPFFSQALTGIVRLNAHYAAVAGFLGSRAMGLYTTAYRLANLPSEGVVTPVSIAVFPAYARLQADVARRRAAFVTSLRYIAAVGLPFCALLAALAPAFAEGVLGPRWVSMAPILSVLGVWGALCVLGVAVTWFINAVGGASYVARIYLLQLAVGVPALVLAATLIGSPEAVGLVLVADALAELVLAVLWVRRELAIGIRELSAALAGIVTATAALTAVALAVRLACDAAGLAAVLQLVCGAAAGCLAFLVVVALLDRRLLSEGARLAKNAVGRA